MQVLITACDPVICKTPDAPLHCLPFCKVKWQNFDSRWQILHASFWKFSKFSNSGISLNWSIIDEVTTRKTRAYFLAHSVVLRGEWANYMALPSLRASCRGDFVVPRTNRKIGHRAFAVAAPRAWNPLPTDLKLQQSTTAFRRHSKTCLFNRTSYRY